MDQDRRAIIRQMVRGGLMLTVLPLLPGRAQGSGGEAGGHLYAFIVDTHKCIGCGRCVAACKQENRVPEPFFRTWVERYTITVDQQVVVDSPRGAIAGFKPQKYVPAQVARSYFVPKLCNHCRNPNCVQVCPVGATYVSREGFVLVDEKQCVGCSYCVQACPYGARFVNPESHTADKCTWCYHRVKQGKTTACVTVCPTGARQFGRIDRPGGAVYEIVMHQRLQMLKPETGNEPMVLYAGLDKEVR